MTSQRLIELATRIAGDALPAAHEPVPPAPLPAANGVNGHAISARDRLAERIAALAAADAPGTHTIAPTHAPQPLASTLPVAPPPSPAPAPPRLADMILGQQAVLQAQPPPHMARVAADAPQMAVAPQQHVDMVPLPVFPSAVDIGRMAAAVAEPAPAMPPQLHPAQLQMQPAPVPAHAHVDRQPAPPPVLPAPGESWRERLLADGLPGFLAGIFVALAIGIALYILLRRL